MIKLKKKRVKIGLILIILLAAVLRLPKLADYPAGLNADEAAIGYNAYSLIETGKDEHGQSFPIHFKSFGDYKPGAYFYLVLPLVKLLGLNVWAVRLPSAILGVLSVWLIYLLTKELLEDEAVSLLAGFFLAISPWHLHFSRGGWEANAGTTLILAGTYFFFKARKKPSCYWWSLMAYLLSLYTYHSARLIVPLLGLGLVAFYRRSLLNQRKRLFLLGLMALILTLPLAIGFLSPAGVSRFSGVGLLADSGPIWRANELRTRHANPMALPVRLLHNRYIFYGLRFLENWFDHFQGGFLFIFGDVIDRSRIPETGQMHFFDIFWLVLGVSFLLKNRVRNRRVIFLWLLIAPLAAALTFQTPHALRAHNMVIPLMIIIAYGFYQTWLWVKKDLGRRVRVIYGLLVVLSLFWSVGRYLHQYYIHYPKTYPFAWEDGFESLVTEVKEIKDDYSRIYVTDRYDQPYILFLFYLQYPPEKFQQEVKLTPRDKFGFATVEHFDKFYFETIDWEKIMTDQAEKPGKILVIGTPEEIGDQGRIIEKVMFKNDQPAFLLVEEAN